MDKKPEKGGNLEMLKIAVGALVLVVAVFAGLSWKSAAELSETSEAAKDSIGGPELSTEFPAPERIQGEGMIVQAENEPEEKSGPPKPSEMPFAVAVKGNALTVIIPGFESMGEVSVEKYDRDGNATGQPLNRGTPVQIPDPNRPGEKIYFKVP